MTYVINGLRSQYKRYLNSKEFRTYCYEKRTLPYKKSKRFLVDQILKAEKMPSYPQEKKIEDSESYKKKEELIHTKPSTYPHVILRRRVAK